jgi:hypothetical protein
MTRFYCPFFRSKPIQILGFTQFFRIAPFAKQRRASKDGSASTLQRFTSAMSVDASIRRQKQQAARG